mmetsp:Transcript_692/g.1344  ORF Transcript_692/g.1344 Transcript_692/m.1344 type:complete len:83 (-) Transcript_692:313-561(-)
MDQVQQLGNTHSTSTRCTVLLPAVWAFVCKFHPLHVLHVAKFEAKPAVPFDSRCVRPPNANPAFGGTEPSVIAFGTIMDTQI